MDNNNSSSDINMMRFLYFSKKQLLSNPTNSLIEQCKIVIDNASSSTTTTNVTKEIDELKGLVILKEKEIQSINENKKTITTSTTTTIPTTDINTITETTKITSIITKKQTKINDNNEDTISFDDTTSAEKIQSLLNQQKTLLSKELEEEKKSQDILALELADLTNVLKEATLSMHQSVHQQNIQLDQIQHHAIENVEELERQKNKMSEREKVMKTSLWGTFGSVIWVIVLFLVTYIVIRFVPKPR